MRDARCEVRGARCEIGIAERWQRLAVGVNPRNDCGQRFGAAERRQHGGSELRAASSEIGIAERWQRLAMGVNPWND